MYLCERREVVINSLLKTTEGHNASKTPGIYCIFVLNFVSISLTILKLSSGHHFYTENYKEA